MLSEKEKTKSLTLLQILVTLFIMLAPSVLSYADTAIYAYVLMLCSGALLLLRIIHIGKIYTSLLNYSLVGLGCYSLLSGLWVTNRSMHFVYLSCVAIAVFVISLATDYFTETPDKKSGRRMMYLISVGSVLCALVNFIYWITDIVPFGKNESFSRGMGTNHFLAVFMMLGIVVTIQLFKGNSKLRRILFVFGTILMLFVLFNCKSIYGWMFLVALAVAMLLGKKQGKKSFAAIAVTVSVFTVALLVVFFLSKESLLFKEVFSYGNLFGKGGGFLSANELFTTVNYKNITVPGLLPLLYVSSGIVGLLCALLLLVKAVLHFVKLRTWISVLNLLLTIMIMFLPLGNSLTTLVLWLGIIAYNEKEGNFIKKRHVRFAATKVTPVVICIVLIVAVFICQRFMVLGAHKQFQKTNYDEAYSLYNAAASVNIFDSESALGAAKSLYEGKNAAAEYEKSIEISKKAQQRDKNNLQCYKIEAQIHNFAGKYNLAVDKYSEISSRARVNYEYNLLLAKSLYNIIETSPEGSAETIAAYEKIVEIAKNTDNLDYREQINNIGDKALVHKRRRTEIE